MLVTHPHFEFSRIQKTETNTMPSAWGRIITSRMGLHHTITKSEIKWKGLIDGMPMIITKKINTLPEHYLITCQPCHLEAIVEAITQEINNGQIITQTPINR